MSTGLRYPFPVPSVSQVDHLRPSLVSTCHLRTANPLVLLDVGRAVCRECAAPRPFALYGNGDHTGEIELAGYDVRHLRFSHQNPQRFPWKVPLTIREAPP